MQKLRHLATALALSAACAAAQASPVTINFDSLGSDVVVGSTYAGLGVTFSNAVTAALSLPGGSGSISIGAVSGGYQPQPSNPIVATFTTGVSSVSLTGLDVGLNGFVMTAYDAAVGGSVVDTDQVFGSSVGIGEFFTLNLTGSNIFRVEFSQVRNVVGDGVLFDNFVFDKAGTVPEPSSLLLAALGMAGLVSVSRKRRA